MPLEKKDFLYSVKMYFDADGNLHAVENQHRVVIVDDGNVLSESDGARHVVRSPKLAGPAAQFLAAVNQVQAEEEAAQVAAAEAERKAAADKIAAKAEDGAA